MVFGAWMVVFWEIRGDWGGFGDVIHCGPDPPKIQTYWATHLSVRLHCSVICLLRTACFAALICWLTHSRARGKVND